MPDDRLGKLLALCKARRGAEAGLETNSVKHFLRAEQRPELWLAESERFGTWVVSKCTGKPIQWQHLSTFTKESVICPNLPNFTL
jgi:hypothetical protein